VLEVAGVDDIGIDELAALVGLKNAIEDNETTVEAVFRPNTQSDGASELNTALGTKGRKAPAPAKCGICGRSDGTHDPDKACYVDG
jgi:hypothetical protein